MQIPLSFKLKPNKSLDSILGEKNQLLIQSFQKFLKSSHNLFYIQGEVKSGKSHLLEALQNDLIDNKHSSVLLDSKVLLDRAHIQIIQLFNVILIDDIDEISGNELAEENLFTWINEVNQNNKKLILTSKISPKSKQWQLPDLISRLQAGLMHQTELLAREDLIQMFKLGSSNRGMKIDNKVINYIESNCPMNPRFILSLLYQLDNITLAKKRQVTVPLIKQIINSNLVN